MMRRIAILFLLALNQWCYSQVPQQINYQGVARRVSGLPFANTTIGLQFIVRQGSSTGTPVFTEKQSVTSNTLGLFTTQIGNATPGGLSSINWQNNSYFLEVDMDTTGGENFAFMGVQQIMSVPFALYSGSVPSAYNPTTGVLSIGQNTHALNTASPVATLTLSGNTLGISNGNTVALSSYTVGSGLTMSGGPDYTITSSAASPTIHSAGVALVSPLSGSDFTVSVPNPSVSINGTLLTLSQGSAVSTATLNTYSAGSGISINGGPNYTISSTAASPTIQGAGVASVNPSSGSNFTVTVPNPTIAVSSGTLLTLTQGTAIATATLPTAAASSLTLSGTFNNSLTAGGNTVALNTYTAGTGITLSGGPNYTISSTAVNHTIQAAGVAAVSPTSGTSFTVTVPNPTIAVSSGTLLTLTQGTAIATATLPTAAAASLTLSGTFNNSLTAGGNTVALNTYTAGTGITLAGGPNYTINSTAVNPTIQAGGLAVVSPTTGTNFTVTVPSPTLSSISNSITITQGTAVSTVSVPVSPTPTIAATTTAAAGALVSSSGSSFSINIPPPTFTNTGQTIILGTYPNFTVNTPTVATTPSVFAAGIAGVSAGPGYTVTVPAPALTSNSNSITLTQGTVVTTASVTTTPNTSLVSSGIAATSTLGINSYSVNVPAPVLTSNNNSITLTQGTVITTASVTTTPNTSLVSSGIAATSTLGINSYSVNVPAPVLTSNNNSITLTQGTVITTASVTTTPNTSLVSSGIAATSTLGINSYSVNVPAPVLTSNNNSITLTQGTVITTASVTTTPNTSLVSSGIAATSTLGINSYSVNVPAPVLTSNNNSITLTQGTVITTASVTTTPNTSLVSSGIAATSTLGINSYSVNVPAPSLTSTGNSVTITQGTAVSTASVASIPPSLSLSGTLNNSLTAGANTIGLNTYTVSGSGLTMTGGPNYIITSVVPNPTVLGFGVASVSPTTGINFSVTVPNPTVSVTSGTLLTLTQGTAVSTATIGNSPTLVLNGANNNNLSAGSNTVVLDTYTAGTGITISGGPNHTISAASNSILGTGIATVNPASGNSFTVDVASPTFTGTGATTVTGTWPNYTVNTPAAITPSITGVGLASVNPASGTNFTVTVPALTYTASSGILASGTNTVNTNPLLTLTGSSLSVGASTNFVNLSSISPFTVSGSSIFQSNLSNSVGIGTSAPSAKLDVVESSTFTGSYIKAQNGNSTSTANIVDISSNGTGFALNVFNNNASTTAYAGYFDGGIRTRGKTTNNTGYAIRALDFSTNDLFAVRNDGNVGIGNSSPATRLHVYNSSGDAITRIETPTGTNEARLEFVKFSGTFSAAVGFYPGNADLRLRTMSSAAVVMEPNSVEVLRADPSGNVGIGNATPHAPLQFTNTIINRKIVLWEGANNDHQFYGFGIGGSVLRYQTDASSADHVFYSAINSTSSTELFRIMGAGRVGINNSAPTATLDVVGTVKIADGTQGANKVLTTDASGNASWQQVGVPSGAIMAYGGATVPPGWLLCDGSQVSRTTYANLFAAIGTAWGSGNGTTTFHLPDMRGMFIRGVDGAAGNDPDKATRVVSNTGGNTGNAVGSKQTDDFQSHTHTITMQSQALAGLGLTNVMVNSGSTTSNATGGNETRPVNVYVYYIIKQ